MNERMIQYTQIIISYRKTLVKSIEKQGFIMIGWYFDIDKLER